MMWFKLSLFMFCTNILPIVAKSASMEGRVNCRGYELLAEQWECACPGKDIPVSKSEYYNCKIRTAKSKVEGSGISDDGCSRKIMDIGNSCPNKDTVNRCAEKFTTNFRRAAECENQQVKNVLENVFEDSELSLSHLKCAIPELNKDIARLFSEHCRYYYGYKLTREDRSKCDDGNLWNLIDTLLSMKESILLDALTDRSSWSSSIFDDFYPGFEKKFYNVCPSLVAIDKAYEDMMEADNVDPKKGTWHKKMLDHLAAKGLMNGQARFEHEWVFLLRSEFNYHDTQLLSEGTFSEEELDAIKDYLNRIQVDIDRRTAFSDQPSIGKDQGRSIPNSIHDEPKAQLDKILHMWDDIAAIGGMVSGAAGGSHPILEQGTQGRRGGAIDTKIYAPESGPWR